jgi:hypothetical protein
MIEKLPKIKVKNGVLIDDITTVKVCYVCGRPEGVNYTRYGKLFVEFKLNVGACYGNSRTFNWVCDSCASAHIGITESDAKAEMKTLHKKIWNELKDKTKPRKDERYDDFVHRIVRRIKEKNGFVYEAK